MRCPFRFKEFSTEEGHQSCVDDCALLMQYNNSDQYKVCAFALIARSFSNNVWMPVNYRKRGVVMTDSKTATELLPCPCCGSEHVETCREFWGGAAPAGSEFSDEVMCDDCGLIAPSIEAWNTRTPEQAIAATLGSEREAKLIRAMEDVLRHATDTVWVSEIETLVDRMVSLGVYGCEVYEGARPWEVD